MTTPAAADVLDRGRKDGILARCIASRSCPKIIHIDSDWEQWQQAGSLVVSDALGQPIELPENVRAFMVASAPHASLPPRAGIRQPPSDLKRGICEQRSGRTQSRPLQVPVMVSSGRWYEGGDNRIMERCDLPIAVVLDKDAQA